MLYGTTYAGGLSHKGTVFVVNPSSGQERVLHSFRGGNDGANSVASLIAVNGTLYGTTFNDGLGCGCGTVFALNLASGKETVIYRFQGGQDGGTPDGGLFALNGNLYGATAFGGGSACGSNPGCGTIFAINLATGQETIVYRFLGGENGGEPVGSLIDVHGTFYGATTIGGSRCNCGTVFALNPSSGKQRVLHRFIKTDGEYPDVGLTALNGTLYGTTGGDGSALHCTVYAITP